MLSIETLQNKMLAILSGIIEKQDWNHGLDSWTRLVELWTVSSPGVQPAFPSYHFIWFTISTRSLDIKTNIYTV